MRKVFYLLVALSLSTASAEEVKVVGDWSRSVDVEEIEILGGNSIEKTSWVEYDVKAEMTITYKASGEAEVSIVVCSGCLPDMVFKLKNAVVRYDDDFIVRERHCSAMVVGEVGKMSFWWTLIEGRGTKLTIQRDNSNR